MRTKRYSYSLSLALVFTIPAAAHASTIDDQAPSDQAPSAAGPAAPFTPPPSPRSAANFSYTFCFEAEPPTSGQVGGNSNIQFLPFTELTYAGFLFVFYPSVNPGPQDPTFITGASDLADLRNNGTPYTPAIIPQSITTVPEPLPLTLLATGVLALLNLPYLSRKKSQRILQPTT